VTCLSKSDSVIGLSSADHPNRMDFYRNCSQPTAFGVHCLHNLAPNYPTIWSQGFHVWRQDLCHHRTTSLEQSAAQSQTVCAVIQPVQAVTGDIFVWIVRPRCNAVFNCAITQIFLLTYLRQRSGISYARRPHCSVDNNSLLRRLQLSCGIQHGINHHCLS